MFRNCLKGYVVVLVIALESPLGALAQETTTQDPHQLTAKSFVARFAHDDYRLWTSPFRFGDYDSHTMQKYGLPFILISGGLIATDHKTADALPNTQDQTTWSGRV